MRSAQSKSPAKNTEAKKKRRRSIRGFSLMEVIASSTILIIGLTGVVAGTGAALNVLDKQVHATMALHLAEQVMEGLLMRFPGDGDLALDPAAHRQKFSSLGNPVTSNEFYTVKWVVYEYRNADGDKDPAGLIQINLETIWETKTGDHYIDLVSVRR